MKNSFSKHNFQSKIEILKIWKVLFVLFLYVANVFFQFVVFIQIDCIVF